MQNNRLNIQILQSTEAWETVDKTIHEKFHKLQQEHVADLDGEIEWTKINENIISTQQETIASATNTKYKTVSSINRYRRQ